MKANMKKKQGGFTLVEVIAALVIGAIAATMVYSYFSTSLTGSTEPIKRLQQANNLQLVMENIIADYNRLNEVNTRYKWRSAHPYHLNAIVLPSTGIDNNASAVNNNGRYYQCTVAGTSYSLGQPAWTTTSGLTSTYNDGTIQWRESGRVWLANTTYNANDIVVPLANNGHFYKCTFTTAGTTSGLSGAAEPSWPAATGGAVTDNVITWVEAGTILKSNRAVTNVENLYENLPSVGGTSATYGDNYILTAKEFIRFDSGNTATTSGVTEDNMLRVTIKDSNSVKTLTSIFTIR